MVFGQLRGKHEAAQFTVQLKAERLQAVNNNVGLAVRFTEQQQQEHLAEALDFTGVRVHKAPVTPESRS